ncbi:MAG: dTMP kinase [Spirochaetae bacterium HGW-Spirochaetae-10]|nr:MAG: dTMP kinase [Spirochaetae bacterium HGW-Spirochaetae-10]
MNVRKKGLFCVVEGMDGAGKTTALQVLSDWIQGTTPVVEEARSAIDRLRSRTVVFLREPTSLETGLEIRRRLSSDEPTEFRDWIRLFRADREANLQTFVRPSLSRGEIVVQDRYLYSTAAYQGAFADIGPKGVLAEFADFPSPDLLIFLDIDEKTAFARMQARSGDREVFERPDRWRRIRDAYREVLPANAVIIDTALPVQVVAGQVAAALAQHVMTESN